MGIDAKIATQKHDQRNNDGIGIEAQAIAEGTKR
jgi:hypothetical protein